MASVDQDWQVFDSSRTPYFEDPVNLKCGYICCHRCLRALPTEPGGQGVRCSNCSKVSQTADIKPNRVLGRLAAKAKAMEPQMASVLQMDPKISKFHVDMTLDVDTAHNYLTISEDLQRVRIGDLPQGRRAHPGRFNDSPCVLGSPHFTSGRHYWEVDVGSSRQWNLGLCRESAPRQDEVVLSVELGFWTVSCQDGNQFIAGTEPALGLMVQPRLHRLGLFLDVEMGTFSFYHVADGSHVFTFPAISAGEPLRPFFGPADCTGDAESWLALCP
ncbi:ret finger protein-like 4A [Myotis lucifugus]|uniref:ret finger protein-like 4A n=1 Tax=Myotis lucifugus TaxID=59463 RepID=UPI0003C452E2|nr:ret finger protein-like 4A [Myotis lucifugus]